MSRASGMNALCASLIPSPGATVLPKPAQHPVFIRGRRFR